MHTQKWNKPRYLMIQIFCAVFVVCVLSFLLFYMAHVRSAEVNAAETMELSYKTVAVMPEDTLWSIAKENYTEEYGSLKSYIREIKRCNSLTSDHINAGSSLLIPVYVPAAK